MKKKLYNYIDMLEHLEISSGEEKEGVLKDITIKIGFFQHERLIHLIVTLAFALFEAMAFAGAMVSGMAAVYILAAAVLALLIPYIIHYYFLENGTQRLYELYDEIKAKDVEITGRSM